MDSLKSVQAYTALIDGQIDADSVFGSEKSVRLAFSGESAEPTIVPVIISPGWQPIEMPPEKEDSENKHYLGTDGKEVTEVCFVERGAVKIVDIYDDRIIADVWKEMTHWMPLPEPPAG